MIRRIGTFPRRHGRRLREAGCELSDAQRAALAGFNEPVSAEQITQFYLPLARLILLHYHRYQSLRSDLGQFLHTDEPQMPFIIGVAGSVAVGKSARWHGCCRRCCGC